MAKQPHFSKSLFQFLAELRTNNERDWFNENKGRFEAEVKAPLIRFIEDFAPKLEKISPHYVADPRGNGGSMFRIYRDTRFSKDKTPYKTHAAAQFRHAQGKDVHAPGFYLHLEPGNVFVGCGLWHPDSAALKKIRAAISEDAPTYKRALGRKAFKDRFTLGGDSLVRAPKGYDPDHPMIEDLRRKDFVCLMNLSDRDACSPDFLKTFTDACKAASPLMKFLTEAIELPY